MVRYYDPAASLSDFLSAQAAGSQFLLDTCRSAPTRPFNMLMLFLKKR